MAHYCNKMAAGCLQRT